MIYTLPYFQRPYTDSDYLSLITRKINSSDNPDLYDKYENMDVKNMIYV